MGTIIIGKNNPMRVDSGNITEMSKGVEPAKSTLSEEEKANLLSAIKQLPKEKWVSALRSAGLDAEADDCERSLAEEYIHEMALEVRSKRLAEIRAMDEKDQLPVLLEEGFEEEAKELAERLDALNSESESTNSNAESNVEASEAPVEEVKTVDEEPKEKPAGKRGGRRKKNA